MNLQIITVKEAKANGLLHYYTGKPCINGHIAKRYVKGGCEICQRESTKSQYKKYTKQKNLETHLYRVANREKARAIQRNYYSRNKEKIRAGQTLTRATRLLRVPKWSQKDIILDFYLACPKDCHVDHIIPLQGRLVSGLHVFENLQYLTESENKSKGNKYSL